MQENVVHASGKDAHYNAGPRFNLIVNGTLLFDTTPGDQQIVVHATGEDFRGPARFDLLVNGEVIEADVLVPEDRGDAPFVFHVDGALDIETVGVAFTNDAYRYSRDGSTDRNLIVSKVEFNGETYTPADDAIFIPKNRRDFTTTLVEAENTGIMRWNGVLEFSDTDWTIIEVFAAGEGLGLPGSLPFNFYVNGATRQWDWENVSFKSRGPLPDDLAEVELERLVFKLDPDTEVETVGINTIYDDFRYLDVKDIYDYNLYVAGIAVNGVHYTPGPDATFSGPENREFWAAADDDGYIQVNGTLLFDTTPGDQQIVVHAAGEDFRGPARFDLLVNGEVIEADVLVPEDRGDAPFVFHVDGALDIETVGVAFTNDAYRYSRDGSTDRNLIVSKVEFNGETYTPADDAIFIPKNRRDFTTTLVEAENTGIMRWNGVLEFSDTDWTIIEVFAAGEGLGWFPGALPFNLYVNGATRRWDWENIAPESRGPLPDDLAEVELERFVFKLDPDTDIETVGINTSLDGATYQAGVRDLNLYVAGIAVDGVHYKPGPDATFTTPRGENREFWAAADDDGYIQVNGTLLFEINDQLIA